MKKTLKSIISFLIVLVIMAGSFVMFGCDNGVDPNLGNNGGEIITPGEGSGEGSGSGSSGESSGSGSSGGDSGGQTPQKTQIKNVIFMIPDGGGYDNLTLASKVKQRALSRGLDSLAGARTKLTTTTLNNVGLNYVKGLYLERFYIGSSKTESYDASTDAFRTTDSAAGGTALATGSKTRYGYVGIDKDRNPLTSITELAQLKGKSTGLVTTKHFADATPLTFFSAHSINRYETVDNSWQALLSNVDVAIGEGTEYGDVITNDYPSIHPNVKASTMGYSVATTKAELESIVNSGAKKVWGALSGIENASNKPTLIDATADHIEYDVEQNTTNPSLLEMTKSALTVLANNINNENGFFLMIEGGAIDNAAEIGNLRYAIGDTLAYDETFAYCVKWAKENGDDTLVISVADHDSGGFYGIEPKLDTLCDIIIDGKSDSKEFSASSGFNDYKLALNAGNTMSFIGGHTKMPVPISAYIPENRRADLIYCLGLPKDSGPSKVRNYGEPNYYSLTSVNDTYAITNDKIAPAICKIAKLGSLTEAVEELYVEVCRYNGKTPDLSFNQLGTLTFGEALGFTTSNGSTHKFYPVTFTSNDGKFVVTNNSTNYMLSGQLKNMDLIGTKQTRSLFISKVWNSEGVGGSFYLPKSLVDQIKAG